MGPEWLAKAQQGDAEAFARAFEALRPSVFAVACRLAGPDDAEDVVMETYLRAWQALPSFEGRASLKSWLYRIAFNCATDLRRRQQRSPEVHPEPAEDGQELVERVADPGAVQPGESLEADESRQQVGRALRLLPAEHRVALELRYAEGLSYAEIAAATGIGIGTVMSRLFNAKRKLKKALAQIAREEQGAAESREGGQRHA
jgi:RNA polymerase sigma-70 factor (ECF subfamily)